MTEKLSVVGQRVPRWAASEKVTGSARYLADIKLPGMLVGKILCSPHAHANILNIDTSKAKNLPGVEAVITWKDVPRILYNPNKMNLINIHPELELKDRELVSFLLQLSQKNELVAKASGILQKTKSKLPNKQKDAFDPLDKLLKSNLIQQLDWSMIESQIEKSHPGFIGRLQAQHPGISAKDKKLCSYVRLGLSSKEMAGLLNITPQSVEIARVRLRKKLQIPPKIRLSNYILQL